MNCLDFDDEGSRSPLLQAITVKRTPSPDPSFLPPAVCNSSSDSDRDSDLRAKPKRKNERKYPPTQGDAVLIGCMSNGNRPDLAIEAGEKPLVDQEEFETDTASTADELNQEMECEPPDIPAADTPKAPQENELFDTKPEDCHSAVDQERSRPKVDTGLVATKQDVPRNKESNFVKTESVQQYPYLKRKPSLVRGDAARNEFKSNGTHPEPAVNTRKRSLDSDSPKPNTPGADHSNQVAESPSTVRPPFSRPFDHNHNVDTDSIATSPNLGQYTIPDSQGSPMDTLPPLQNSPIQSMKSPTAQHSLPSLHSQLGSLSTVPPPLEPAHPPHSSTFPPRASFNPVNGSAYSPPQAFKPPRAAHYPSIQTISNAFHGFPTTEPSSASTVSDASHPSPRETYRPGQDPTNMSPPGKFGPPRPIQSNGYTPGSDVSVQTPQSAESHQSISSFSTETSPSVDRMSIDGDRPVLPLPSGNEPIVSGGFKCDYSGCTAPPFQTQYLLK